MIKRVGTAIATVTAAAAFAGGCSSGLSETALTPNDPGIEQAFNAAKGYWSQQNVDMGSLILQTITPDSATQCGKERITSDSLIDAQYCSGGGNRRVIISSESFDRNLEVEKQTNFIGAEVIKIATINHEVGHDLLAQADIEFGTPKDELLADCLAGVAISHTNPELELQAKEFFGSIGDDTVDPDKTHGTGTERSASFEAGFQKGIDYCDPSIGTVLNLTA